MPPGLQILSSSRILSPKDAPANAVEALVSAGTALIQLIALAWLPPTPTTRISEMPTDESQGPMEA
jgi:hypothetical protein